MRCVRFFISCLGLALWSTAVLGDTETEDSASLSYTSGNLIPADLSVRTFQYEQTGLYLQSDMEFRISAGVAFYMEENAERIGIATAASKGGHVFTGETSDGTVIRCSDQTLDDPDEVLENYFELTQDSACKSQ